MSYGAVIVFLLSTAALAQSSGPFIATAVGLGIRGFDGDGGSATAARLAFPAGIAFDKVGNLYVADSLNNRIRRVTPQGTITTVAGSATSGFGGDGGPATSARLAQPQAVAIDAAGNLFIADTQNNRIRRVSITGTITTVVGSGVCSVTGPRGGYSGDGGPSSAAQISCPTGVAIDSSGNLFIADSQNNRIRKINSAGIITTVAGSGDLNPTVGLGDGGPAVAARLRIPLGVTADRAGNLFIADSQNNRIRRVAVDGTINTIAGGDAGGSASISYPRGVAVDELGNLYVAEDQSNYVRKVEPNGRVSILAGRGTSNFSGDGGVAISGELAQPFAVAVDLDGRVYIADYSNHRVRVVSYASSISTTGIVNAASGIGGGVAPGEFLAIYGSGVSG